MLSFRNALLASRSCLVRLEFNGSARDKTCGAMRNGLNGFNYVNVPRAALILWSNQFSSLRNVLLFTYRFAIIASVLTGNILSTYEPSAINRIAKAESITRPLYQPPTCQCLQNILSCASMLLNDCFIKYWRKNNRWPRHQSAAGESIAR